MSPRVIAAKGFSQEIQNPLVPGSGDGLASSLTAAETVGPSVWNGRISGEWECSRRRGWGHPPPPGACGMVGVVTPVRMSPHPCPPR